VGGSGTHPEVFYIFDEELRFTYVNAMGRAIAERMERKFVGETLFSVVPDLRGTVVEENLTHAITERVAVEFEFYYEPLENWFQYRVYPLPDGGPGDVCAGHYGRAEDGTGAAEIGAACSGGRLAASISHEINNPLEAVTNLLFLAKMDSSIVGTRRDCWSLQTRSCSVFRTLRRGAEVLSAAHGGQLDIAGKLIESVLFFTKPRWAHGQSCAAQVSRSAQGFVLPGRDSTVGDEPGGQCAGCAGAALGA